MFSKYPEGASVSSNVYVPFARFLIICAFTVDVQLALMFPFESFKTNFAPANGLPVTESVFITVTFYDLIVNLIVVFTFFVTFSSNATFCILEFVG